VTNATYIFETSPSTKPTDKNVGGHGISPLSEKMGGGARTPCPPS